MSASSLCIEASGKLTVVGFVHQTHDNIRFIRILCGELAPQIRELVRGRSAGTNYLPVPAGIVVDIDDASSVDFQACLD